MKYYIHVLKDGLWLSIRYPFLSALLGEDLTLESADNILPHVYLETWVDASGMCCYMTPVRHSSPRTLRAVKIGSTTAVATISCEAILASLGKKRATGKYYPADIVRDAIGQRYLRIDFRHTFYDRRKNRRKI